MVLKKSSSLFLFFLLIQVHFFGFTAVSSFVLKLASLVATLTLLCIFLIFRLRPSRHLFIGNITLLFCFVFLNMLTCYYFSGQSFFLFLTGPEFVNILGVLTYFCAFLFTQNIRDVESTVYRLSIVFCFVYVIQFVLLPYGLNFFVVEDLDLEEASLARFRLPGQCLSSFLVFYSIVKFQIEKRFFLIMTALLGLTVLILLNFRFQLLLISLLVVWVLYTYQPNVKKYLTTSIVLVMLFFLAWNLPFVQTKFSQMVSRQEAGHTLDNDDYVRNQAFFYYTFVLPDSNWERVFGVGLPNEKGDYGKSIRAIKEQRLIWADLGLYGLGVMAGFPVLFFMLLYSYRVVKTKMPYEYHYVKFWFIFLVLGSLLSREFYREGAFAIQGVVLYMVDLIIIKKYYESRHLDISQS